MTRNTQALEDNWDGVQQSDVYMEYIATRPRVERLGRHGLFGDEDSVDLKKVTAELQGCEKNVWTHIISLKREDAARLGYDNAKTWRNLLRTHRNDIAATMNIPANEFRWYAVFHDEGEHPHVHMMAWSAGDSPGYLSPVGISQIRSALTNDVFRQEIPYRCAQYKGADASGRADLYAALTDAGKVNPYARDAMAWANYEGLINGVATTTLQPGGFAVRAQAATILMRFCENIVR